MESNVKLFQIEEPDGTPTNPDAPGAAIGIDLTGAYAEVAVAVGGNAVILTDREGFAVDLAVPGPEASAEDWQRLFEGARLRAERALAQPATHAVIALGASATPAVIERLGRATEGAGLTLLDAMAPEAADPALPRACAAAIRAEDLAPPPAGL
jgi:hypothetical protein